MARKAKNINQEIDKEARQGAPTRRVHEVFGILTLAATLLLGPSLASAQFGAGTLMGPFGQTLGLTLHRALGLAGYLLVVALLAVSLRIFAGGLGSAKSESLQLSLWRERIGAALGILCTAVLLHLLVRPARIQDSSAGGWLGEFVAELLCTFFSTPGAWVLGLASFALSLVLATNLSLARAGLGLWHVASRSARSLRGALGEGQRRLRANLAAFAQLFGRRELVVQPGDGAAIMPPPVLRYEMVDEAAVMAGAPEPEMPLNLFDPNAMPDDLEIGVAAEEERLPSARPQIPALDQLTSASDEEAEELEDIAEPQPVAEPELAADAEVALGEAAAPAVEAQPLTIVEPQYKEAHELGGEPPTDEEPALGPGFVLNGDAYRPPPLSLLEYEQTKIGVDRDAIYEQADRLVKTLADYKIRGRVTEVHPGPVVTMYEFVPEPGTKISKVAALANDLAMSLAAQRVRIVAPIPGKGAIGIEVPNEQRTTVYFKEIVAHETFRSNKSKLSLALGKNIFGAPVTVDLAKMPHLLVAGATGAGKSVSINAMICSMLLKSSPEEVRLIMVDPKYLELSGYNDIPHLMLPVVTDPAKANIALRWTVREMERRYQLLADMQVRDIASYNRKVEKLRGQTDAAAEPAPAADAPETVLEAAPAQILVVRRNADGTEEPVRQGPPLPEDEPERTAPHRAEADSCEAPVARSKSSAPLETLPYIVVVIDEFADLMMVASKEVETSVARLAQKARAAGIHVILATQRPSVDVITGLIKANFPSRIAFQVASCHDSKTILSTQGAENLLGNGDMLLLDRGAEMKRIHGAYISDQEIERIVNWLKEQGRPIYDLEILKPKDEDEALEDSAGDDDCDEMYDQAVALVAESRQASISMIQRRLRVGYNRAARMVERMEREGIVSPPDGAKGREVLIQPA